MRESSFGELNIGAAFLHNHIVGRALAFRHHCARSIGKEDQIVLKFLRCGIALGQKFLAAGLKLGDLRLDGFGFCLEALLHEPPDLRGLLLLLGEQGVAFLLEAAPEGIQLQNLFHYRAGFEILYRQFCDDPIGVIP